MFGMIRSLCFLCCFSLHSINVCKTPNDRIARLHGDIMIGGLFPIHNEIPNLGNYTKPQDLICTGFEMRGFLRSLGMIHAIERINNLNLLPGITLGYEIYDTCADASKGVEEAMRFIGKRDSSTGNIEVNCNYTSYSPTVKAVIGAGYSEVSIAVSRLLSFQLIPQISYSSSASILSDKRRFPSFLRTVPSDMHLTKALAMLISKFKWTYVGIISSDDEYGLSVMESLSVNFDLQLVCAAFKEKIPADFGNPQVKKAIKNVIGTIKQSPVTVVILALKVPIVMELFMEIIKQNISRIWIATDNWSTSREVAALKDIQSVGNILGFSFKNGEIPGFRNYLRTLHLERNTTNAFIEEYKHLRFDCSEEYKDYERCLHSSVDNCIKSDSLKLKSSLACSIKNVSLASDDFLERNIELDGSYSAYLAVTAIAKSIKNMLCSNRICNTNTTFLPWQLLQEVKKIRFYDYDEDVFFNKKGDANIGYDLLSWYTVNESMQFHVVGRYEPDNISIHVNSSQIVWNTPNNKVPDSKCSKSCAPGQYKIHSTIRCCYNCSQCAEGYYSRDYDMNQCTKCPFGQWSNNGSSHCENQTIEYFQWSDPFAILLCSFSFIGFLLVLIMGIVFFKYVTTPAVKAAGGIYICVMNMSLLISFASTGFFIGEPSQFSCKIRQPMYGISFTLCVSCILIKSFRIVLAFELGKRVKNNVKLTYQPFLVVIALTCFQVGVCIIWLAIKSPDVRAINIIPQKLILQCDEGSNLGYGIMLGYIGFLAFVCFALAYKGRNLPDIYNECRLITFSMLIYLFVWFAFIPVYLTTTGKYLSAVEIVAILASNYGVICCHLIPTCYIIFFKKNINRRETYLQSIKMYPKGNFSITYYSTGSLRCESKASQTCLNVEQRDIIFSSGYRKRSGTL